jgi:hypothetical protein
LKVTFAPSAVEGASVHENETAGVPCGSLVAWKVSLITSFPVKGSGSLPVLTLPLPLQVPFQGVRSGPQPARANTHRPSKCLMHRRA